LPPGRGGRAVLPGERGRTASLDGPAPLPGAGPHRALRTERRRRADGVRRAGVRPAAAALPAVVGAEPAGVATWRGDGGGRVVGRREPAGHADAGGPGGGRPCQGRTGPGQVGGGGAADGLAQAGPAGGRGRLPGLRGPPTLRGSRRTTEVNGDIHESLADGPA